MRQTRRIVREADRRRCAGVCDLRILLELRDELLTREAAILVGTAYCVAAVVEAVEGLLDFGIIERHRTCGGASERDVRDRHAPRQNSRHGGAKADRLCRPMRTRQLREHAIHPSVGRRLHAGCAALHVVLGIEMRARWIRRTARVNERQCAVMPPRHHRIEGRMEPEMTVEVEHGAIAAATRNRNRRTRVIVVRIAVRNDHVQAVDGATQEDYDEAFAAGVFAGSTRGPCVRAQQENSRGGEKRGTPDELPPANRLGAEFAKGLAFVAFCVHRFNPRATKYQPAVLSAWRARVCVACTRSRATSSQISCRTSAGSIAAREGFHGNAKNPGCAPVSREVTGVKDSLTTFCRRFIKPTLTARYSGLSRTTRDSRRLPHHEFGTAQD